MPDDSRSAITDTRALKLGEGGGCRLLLVNSVIQPGKVWSQYRFSGHGKNRIDLGCSVESTGPDLNFIKLLNESVEKRGIWEKDYVFGLGNSMDSEVFHS